MNDLSTHIWMAEDVLIRSLRPDDLKAVATVWHDAWHDAHGGLVPELLTKTRTMRSFKNRLSRMQDRVIVAGETPMGFCAVENGELEHLFVASGMRGTGIADALLDAGEAQIRASGHQTGFLFCLPKNLRAVRFYERHGWERTSLEVNSVRTHLGSVAIKALRFEKPL